MSNYAVFFNYDNATYRLPVNPEEIKVTSTQAIEKYEILKLGQIAVPTHMELKEYEFEAEFPSKKGNYIPHYVEIKDIKEFRSAAYYLKLFRIWREKLIPVQFLFGIDSDEDEQLDKGKSNSVTVLIEELEIIEKAGEEGDKYVNFKLLEYRSYGEKVVNEIIEEITSEQTVYTAKPTYSTVSENPKSNGYHIVQSGDSLWTIAKKYYGDGSKSNIIFNANKSIIKNPAVLSVGWKLKIPSKDEFSKYSDPLPTTKKTSDTSSATSYKNGVGRIDVLNGTYDNVSSGGHSHSTSTGSF